MNEPETDLLHTILDLSKVMCGLSLHDTEFALLFVVQDFYVSVSEDAKLIPALKDQLPELEAALKQK